MTTVARLIGLSKGIDFPLEHHNSSLDPSCFTVDEIFMVVHIMAFRGRPCAVKGISSMIATISSSMALSLELNTQRVPVGNQTLQALKSAQAILLGRAFIRV